MTAILILVFLIKVQRTDVGNEIGKQPIQYLFALFLSFMLDWYFIIQGIKYIFNI